MDFQGDVETGEPLPAPAPEAEPAESSRELDHPEKSFDSSSFKQLRPVVCLLFLRILLSCIKCGDFCLLFVEEAAEVDPDTGPRAECVTDHGRKLRFKFEAVITVCHTRKSVEISVWCLPRVQEVVAGIAWTKGAGLGLDPCRWTASSTIPRSRLLKTRANLGFAWFGCLSFRASGRHFRETSFRGLGFGGLGFRFT